MSSIERQIEDADGYSCNRENAWQNVRIDQLIQIVEQESAMIGVDSGLLFEPVLKHGQRAGQEKLRENSPDKRKDMKPPRNRTRAHQQSAKDYPQEEQNMNEKNRSCRCRTEACTNDDCMHG